MKIYKCNICGETNISKLVSYKGHYRNKCRSCQNKYSKLRYLNLKTMITNPFSDESLNMDLKRSLKHANKINKNNK